MKLTLEQATVALQVICENTAKLDALGMVEHDGSGKPNCYLKGYVTVRDLRMILDVLESIE